MGDRTSSFRENRNPLLEKLGGWPEPPVSVLNDCSSIFGDIAIYVNLFEKYTGIHIYI